MVFVLGKSVNVIKMLKKLKIRMYKKMNQD